MKIKSAHISDLKEIKILTETCAVAMQEKGIFQWNEHYPSLKKLETDIEKKELYVLKEDEEIKGIVVLTDFMDEDYIPIEWLTDSGNNLYIHLACYRSRSLG
ncbi:hypothetical protein [Antarcticibacterium sp. 1MA-6-2]|uniref:hypothetical protein n=1 Tax=Antarcticibacterium sp. 1MA-6-2 TaxID=2908210 RepID=UPI0028833329|nr:hypothetical protein [Antarcticibacterium sp. 1MA-6-2]